MYVCDVVMCWYVYFGYDWMCVWWAAGVWKLRETVRKTSILERSEVCFLMGFQVFCVIAMMLWCCVSCVWRDLSDIGGVCCVCEFCRRCPELWSASFYDEKWMIMICMYVYDVIFKCMYPLEQGWREEGVRKVPRSAHLKILDFYWKQMKKVRTAALSLRH